MPFEVEQQRAGGGIPYLRSTVIRRGDNARAIGAEYDGIDCSAMPYEVEQQCTGGGVPNLRGVVIRRGDLYTLKVRGFADAKNYFKISFYCSYLWGRSLLCR